jgi:hypothetical protein
MSDTLDLIKQTNYSLRHENKVLKNRLRYLESGHLCHQEKLWKTLKKLMDNNPVEAKRQFLILRKERTV